MTKAAIIALIFLLGGCGINQIKDLSIPNPNKVDSLRDYLNQKMGEPVERGASWSLYNVYSDYNDGVCRRGSPRNNSTHITEKFFTEFLGRYASENSMYVIHADKNLPVGKNLVNKPYLYDKSEDVASFSHASALVPGEPLPPKAVGKLDREKYVIISETKPKPQKYGNVFYLSTSPDLADIKEAVVVALHTHRWLTTNQLCNYSEYHWTIFHANHVDRQYLSDITRAENDLRDQELDRRHAIAKKQEENLKRDQMERRQWLAAQEKFKRAASKQKQVGDMVGSAENVLAYVEAVANDKVKLSVIGKVQPFQQNYFLFHPNSVGRKISTRKTNHDTIWASSKEWASVSLKLDM